MNTPEKLLSYAAVVFPVGDIASTVNFYHEKLSFDISFQIGDPVNYAVVKKDNAVQIHLTLRRDTLKPSVEHAAMYIFAHDVDYLHLELQQKQVTIKKTDRQPAIWHTGF